jgi:protein gp37
MADKSIIAWTDSTMNLWMGCFKVSQGCKNCYADTLTTNRMGLDVFGHPDSTPRQRTSKQLWSRPIRWNREAQAAQTPSKVFCMSLGDFFEDAPGPNAWRSEGWDLIRSTPWLDWQVLTKRPENILRMLPDDWGHGWPHVWLGTSIEDNRVAERAPILTSVPAWNHFMSYEPAIGPIDEVDFTGFEWIIVGGESGPGWRKMDLDWARDVQTRCGDLGIAFFFKQDSAPRTEMGTDALGAMYRDYPKSWNRLDGPEVVKDLIAIDFYSDYHRGSDLQLGAHAIGSVPR